MIVRLTPLGISAWEVCLVSGECGVIRVAAELSEDWQVASWKGDCVRELLVHPGVQWTLFRF